MPVDLRRVQDERVIAVLFAVAITVPQHALTATRFGYLGLPLLILQHRLGSRFPRVPLWLLVTTIQIVHLIAFVRVTGGWFWLGIATWPWAASIDAALIATGQNHGRRRRNEEVSAEQQRQASILTGLACTLTALAFVVAVIAATAASG